MRTFEDIHGENVTIGDMQKLIKEVKTEKVKEPFDYLEDFLEANACPFFSQNGSFSGYNLVIVDKCGLGGKWDENGMIGLKSARGYIRGFKTIEPIQKICLDMGFRKISVQMKG